MSSPSNTNTQSICPIQIQDELQSSFLDYAVSVIVSRAIPDVRDGLKPVHRRILYTMHQIGLTHQKPYRKSVKVVGEVLGNFHPHGDQAVYQTMVGMVQDFVRRYPLLKGQGNWGSNDGDNAAAMRYTEIKMHHIAEEILADISKNTVPFVPNFDESTTEPTILPSKIPNLLINGTSGIAVGMATSIPPHNLSEVINACIAYIDNESITIEEIMQHIKAPDFPTGGIICGREGIIKAYQEGRGSLVLRGVTEIEETEKSNNIIIKELPYQVIKADFVAKIAILVKEKVIDGISHIRDESNKDGMRIVIEMKKDSCSSTILNLLYKHTSLQSTVSMIFLALIDNKPKIFTILELIKTFVDHRINIVTKKYIYDKKKAETEEHILAGLEIISAKIEEVVDLIKKSENVSDALNKLMITYNLSEIQGKAVLELRLQKLTSFEQHEIKTERIALLKKIEIITSYLNNKDLLYNEVKKELLQIKENYGDERKTVISDLSYKFMDSSAFIADDEVIITLTQRGYLKRVPLTTYELQRRGGKGKMGISSLDEHDDVIQDIFIAKNHDMMLFFTNIGRVYATPVYEAPEASRTSKGRAIVNLLPLIDGEFVVKLLCSKNLEGLCLVLITKKGTIKRMKAELFSNIRQTGIRAITLDEGDELSFCLLSSGKDSIVVATACGCGIRFNENEVRLMGRQAAGVRAIRLKVGDMVMGAKAVSPADAILFVTENGYGKRVKADEFRIAHRGGQGVRTIPTTERNGKVIGISPVDEETDIILIDHNGKVIRISPQEIRTMGRQAQGVRLIKLDEKQKVSRIATIKNDEREEAKKRSLELADELMDSIDRAISTDDTEQNEENDSDYDRQEDE